MSVLPSATNFTFSDAFFVKVVGASTITANSFTGDRGIFGSLSTGSITVNSISSAGSLVVGSNLVVGNNLTVGELVTSLNITATDTLTSYFNNTQYLTSVQGANIQGLTIAEQIQGTNLVQFPNAILSSITTTSITLDGNTLDTAGAGAGAQLLLNGQPIATASTLTSSILTWSYYPAISNLDMNNFPIGGATTVQGDTAVFYDGNFENQLVVPTVFATTLNSQQTNTNLISTSALVANTIGVNTLQSSTINNALTLTSRQIDTTTLNATDITTATLTTLAGGTVSGANGSFQNLTVTNSANFSGSRPNFTTGINSSGNNNFNNTNLDNCPVINTQNNQSMTIQSANGMDLLAPTRIRLICDAGCNIAGYGSVDLIGRNGNRGQINLTAQPGYISVGGQIQGEVNITANGGGSLTAYATGGLINITANTGSSPVLGTLTYSAIKLNAAGITSYAGFASPFVAVPGYNLIQGSLGIELIAGSIPVIPSVPGTVYLYGFTGIPQQTGGVRCQNGIGVDFIVPYPQGFNTQPYDLIISGNPAGQKVTLSNVRILQSDGGSASGFGSIAGTNITAQNFVLSKNSVDNGLLLGLSGGEQLINFSNVSTLNVQAGLGTFATLVSQQVSTQSLFISTVNGLPFSAIIAPTIPSTFTDLTTSTLQANFISTNTLGAFTINNVSSINGFSLAQLVSSVSPQAPAPSTFTQLFTSSFIANTIQALNISTVALQSQSITGVSTINGFTIADFVSSVSPQAPAPSTFTQLFTSSFVANTITGSSFSPSLKLLGNGVSIEPTLDNSITMTTTGVGLVTLVSQEEVQVFSPSTIVFGDFRATTINGLPPVTSIPTFYPQLTVSSLVGSNISTTVLNAGQILLNGVALSPQVSSFNTLQANSISTAVLTISSVNGYSVDQLVNQPVISTFSNIFVSDAGILNQTSLVLEVSSINGFNTSQFLSTAGDLQLVSTFSQFFTSSLGANTVSTALLNASNVNATSVVSGTATLSSINGFNINQLVNPALSTVSTFQQLFTSSFVANTIQTLNISTNTLQGQSITGVSTINGFTIADFVSSVSPQPPVPSTVVQFFTSSLAVNGITNYQTLDLNLTTPAFMNLTAGVALNLVANQCNVSISSSNLVENIGGFTTNNTGQNYTVTAGQNISLNSSNTLSIYNTNTAPPVGCNDLYILGQGNTNLGSQQTTSITAANNILVNAGQSATFQGNFVVINSPQEIQLVGTQQLRGSASNIAILVPSAQSAIYLAQPTGIELVTNQSMTQTARNSMLISSATVNLNGAVNINGAPYTPGLSSFTTLATDTLRNNTTNNLLITAPFGVNLSTVNQVTITSEEVLTYSRGITNFFATTGIALSTSIIRLDAPITNIAGTLNAPVINLSTINGLPYTTGVTVSSFSNLFTANLFNNPSVGTNLSLNAANNTLINATGAILLSTPSLLWNGAPISRFVSTATSALNMNSFPIKDSTENLTLSTIGSINLNCVVPTSVIIAPVQFATGQVFPQPGLGRFQFLTNNSASTWDNVLITDSFANVYYNAAWGASVSLNFPITVTIGTSGYYRLSITFASVVSEYLVQYEPDGTILYGVVTPTSANFTWGQGANQVGKINLSSRETNITAVSSINLTSPSLLWNGAPIGGGTTVSTFTQLNTNILSNNPAIGNDLLLRAANAIVMTTPGATSISLGDTLEIMGTTGATNIYTQNFTSLNNLIQLTGSNMNLTGQSNITATSLSSINFYSPALLWNGAPIGGGGGSVTSTFTTLFTTTLSNNPVSPNLTIDCAGELTFEITDASINAQSNITLYTLNTDIDLQAGNSINFLTLNSNIFIYATTETITPPTDVLGVYIRAQSNIVIGADEILQLTALSSINITTSTINLTNPQTAIYASTLGVFTDATVNFFSSFCYFQQTEYGSQLVLEKDYSQLWGISSITLQSDVKVDIFSPSTICQGDIRALTFNGAPLPAGGGGSWVSTATSDLNMNGYNITTAASSNLAITGDNNLTLTATSGNVILAVSTAVKLSYPTLSISGNLTLNSNAQLTYAAQYSGYDIGHECKIPLTQYGKVSLTIEEENTVIGGDYDLPCPFDGGEFSVVLQLQNASPIAPGQFINWTAIAVDSNTFQINAIGSNITTPYALSFYYIAVGEYPRGIPT